MKNVATFKLVLLCLFLISFVSLASAQTGGVEDLTITDTDTSSFPQVQLQLRPLGALGIPIAGLTTENFQVTENGRNIPVEQLSLVDEGVFVHFVVDSGVRLNSARWERGREAILDFVQTTPWMAEDKDLIALSIVEANGVRELVTSTSSAADIVRALEQYSLPTKQADQYSDPYAALDDILKNLNKVEGAQSKAQFIVLVTAGIEKNAGLADELRELANDQNVTIQAILLEGQLVESVQSLASETGGIATQFNRLTDLNPLFQKIADYREQYSLIYQADTGASGTRNVVVTAVVGTSGGGFSADTRYDIEVAPPRVLIDSPSVGTVINRTAEGYTENLESIAPTSQTVRANVIFPDGYARRLESATLYVNGEPVDTSNESKDLTFSWNLTRDQILGEHTYDLQVKVVDILGLAAESQEVGVNVNLSVPASAELSPEMQAQLEASEAAVAQAQGQVEQVTKTLEELEGTLYICRSSGALCTYVERPIMANWIAVMLSLSAIGFAGVVYWKRDSAPVQGAVGRVTKAIERITKRNVQLEPKAFLVVLEGDVNVGKSLEIYGDTPIGRSRQNSELIFQQHDEGSPISRLHCTIVDEEDHFKIRDEDSANGTYLNGVRLAPLVEEYLNDSDEIELGRVERGGVRVLFQIADEEFEDGGLRVTHAARSNGGVAPSAFKNHSDDDFS